MTSNDHSWLLTSEAERNIVLGVAARYRHETMTEHSTCDWATIEEDSTVVGQLRNATVLKHTLTHETSKLVVFVMPFGRIGFDTSRDYELLSILEVLDGSLNG